jgi:ribosomal protein L37AE/L43A
MVSQIMKYIPISPSFILMKSVVIDRFTVSNVNFERYNDGACVIESKTPGFLELSAETISRLAGVTPEQVTIKPVSKPTDAVKPAPPKVMASKHTPSSQQSQRSINRLPTGIWQCEFKVDGAVFAVHGYSSRDFARKATITTKIGEDGRVS